MVPRRARARLREVLRAFPAAALLGPRPVGKTILATSRADEEGNRARYLDLKVWGRWVVYPGRERYHVDARTEAVPFTEARRPGFRWAPESR